MPAFFTFRPIFAWVVAIIISLAGLISLTQLPVEQFPDVALPSVNVNVTYPGASADDIDSYVLNLINKEMNGIEGLSYTHSKASYGTGSLTLNFESGTDVDIAQVEVQNRIARVEPKLPATVKQYGVSVAKSRSNFLMIVGFTTSSPNLSNLDMGEYIKNNVIPVIERTKGVGSTQLFGSKKAMRVWTNPNKIKALGISAEEISLALTTQNAQMVGGDIGGTPNPPGQMTFNLLSVKGTLQTPEEFGNVIIRTMADGSLIKLKDIARIEIGKENYAFKSYLNGQEAIGVMINQANGANAVETSKLLKKEFKDIQKYFPEGMSYSISYDTSTFIETSIQKVIKTLFEAIVLVFLVMFLFLQNIRYTFIPTIVVPVSLLGTFFVMNVLGMSINVLSMFAMVLVIGIIVDDAIVVVENVERIMREENLTPIEATIKAMKQIQGAVVGITLILITVFLPLAFFSGTVGNIYKQFAIVMSVCIAFSGFLALSFTPALCGSLLKPHDDEEKNSHLNTPLRKFFGKFNLFFTKTTDRYHNRLTKTTNKLTRMMLVFCVMLICVIVLFKILPKSFLPSEDQGIVVASVQVSDGTTQNRTMEALKKIDELILKEKDSVKHIFTVQGFNFSGTGQNLGAAFIGLKDWSERKKSTQSAAYLSQKFNQMLFGIKGVFGFSFLLPAIQGIGTSEGFQFVLQNREGVSRQELLGALGQILTKASQSKKLTNVRMNGLLDTQQLQLTIDREQAGRYGVSLESLKNIIASNFSSVYVNDFPLGNEQNQVIVQADSNFRKNQQDLLGLTVLNNKGDSVPLSAIVKTQWVNAPIQIERFNGYPAIFIEGSANEGYTSGDAMNEMLTFMKDLPKSFGYEWTGTSREELDAGNKSLYLYLLSIIIVFLCLAALYESWSVPFAVILVVPLGIFGMMVTAYFFKIPNDIYFQIAMVTIMGLSAKNAILIVEFARELQHHGKTPLESALEAAKMRFRPILMTSFAFILGVTPLIFASGASAASQREIGISVFSGMIVGTFLSIFFVPCYYVLIRKFFKPKKEHMEIQ